MQELVALNTIAKSQSNPTQHTAKLCQQLLDYCATYPNVGLGYHKNDMVLHIHSNASYLVAPYAKSSISGYFFHPITQKQQHIMPQYTLNAKLCVMLLLHQLSVKQL